MAGIPVGMGTCNRIWSSDRDSVSTCFQTRESGPKDYSFVES